MRHPAPPSGGSIRTLPLLIALLMAVAGSAASGSIVPLRSHRLARWLAFGDLLDATEGGALADAVSCTMAGCRVRLVAVGPAIAHAEGQIAFAR
jgi:hypothetical protein